MRSIGNELRVVGYFSLARDHELSSQCSNGNNEPAIRDGSKSREKSAAYANSRRNCVFDFTHLAGNQRPYTTKRARSERICGCTDPTSGEQHAVDGDSHGWACCPCPADAQHRWRTLSDGSLYRRLILRRAQSGAVLIGPSSQYRNMGGSPWSMCSLLP